jgi:hypothetical protein
MWIASLSLLTLWMALALLGITLLGFTHLLCAGAIAIEVLRRPARREAAAGSR